MREKARQLFHATTKESGSAVVNTIIKWTEKVTLVETAQDFDRRLKDIAILLLSPRVTDAVIETLANFFRETGKGTVYCSFELP